jgi:hypothetical protein
MRKINSAVLAIAVVALFGCATSHVMIGQARPPISPDLVKIYYHPPETKYEEIALLDTSSKGGFGFTAQGKMDVVINRLKEDAAKLGANGILLQGLGSEAGGTISTGYAQATASGNHAYGSGIGFSGTARNKTGSGLAIYVPPN